MYDWTWSEITAALLRQPYRPGLIGRLEWQDANGVMRPLFRARPQSTTMANIEVRGQRLALVPELPRGAPPTPSARDRRSAVQMRVPHFPVRQTLYADEVQNVRAFGSTDAQSFPRALEDILEELNRELDDTLEFLRLGACTGRIITAVDRLPPHAPTKIIDLHAAFGVAPQTEQEWPILNAGALGQQSAAWSGQLTELCNTIARDMADEIGDFLFVQGIVRVPGHRDHGFQRIVISHSRPS